MRKQDITHIVDIDGTSISVREIGSSRRTTGVILGVFVVILAAYSLVLDFDGIKRGVTNGAARKYGWTAALGLMVTVVWLYLEILRLIALVMGRR